MGSLVAAMASVHSPRLITRPPEDDQTQFDASIAAMRELGRVLDETTPDVLIVIGIDHMETFFLDAVPTFALMVGERAASSFAGRDYRLPIHQPLARSLLDGLVSAGFDITYSQQGELGHAFAVPFEYIHEGRPIPVVPMFVNVYLPPLPTPRRCVELGQAMARIIQERPERVAILASGGMSHYPGTWKATQPEYGFDRWAIQEMEHGNLEALADLTVEQLDEVGNTELLAWMVLFGAMGSRPGELLSYQPTRHHGHAVVRFIPEPKVRARPREHQAYPFKGQGLEFYKYPEPSAYSLNRLLVDLRGGEALRERFFRDMDPVISEYGLSPQQAEAMKKVQLAPVVEAGAHPIVAVTAFLVLQRHQIDAQAAARSA